MTFKRSILILLFITITLSSYGCIGLLIDLLADDLVEDVKEKGPVVIEVIEQEVHDPLESDDKDEGVSEGEEHDEEFDDPNHVDHADDAKDLDRLDLYTLDMSSVDAFIADVKKAYNIELSDERGYLSGSDGDVMMRELDYALSLFSPAFLRALVTEYEEYGSKFFINLEGPSYTEFGMTEWDRHLTITLHYERNPDENGISAAVLAHELAHAVHFIIEEFIGETRSMLDLRFYNGSHDYVGNDYDRIWDPDVHLYFFAYDYGMYDYYEDFATILEVLVAFPEDMSERFSESQHKSLMNKAIYLRDIMYTYISDECFPLFTPLYEAEALLITPAA